MSTVTWVITWAWGGPASEILAEQGQDDKRDRIDLPDGKYRIGPAIVVAPPDVDKLLVGADLPNIHSQATLPVVSGGKDDVWTLHKLEDGKYTLTLAETVTPRISHHHSHDVVVSTKSRPTEWVIRHNKHGMHSIGISDAEMVPEFWTWRGKEPGTKVDLAPAASESGIGQMWVFIPIDE